MPQPTIVVPVARLSPAFELILRKNASEAVDWLPNRAVLDGRTDQDLADGVERARRGRVDRHALRRSVAGVGDGGRATAAPAGQLERGRRVGVDRDARDRRACQARDREQRGRRLLGPDGAGAGDRDGRRVRPRDRQGGDRQGRGRDRHLAQRCAVADREGAGARPRLHDHGGRCAGADRLADLGDAGDAREREGRRRRPRTCRSR